MRSLTYQQKNVHRFHLLRNCLRISHIIFFASLFSDAIMFCCSALHFEMMWFFRWKIHFLPLMREPHLFQTFFQKQNKTFSVNLNLFFSVVPHTHIYTCLEFHYRHFLQLCTSGKLHEHITFFGAVYMIFNEKI